MRDLRWTVAGLLVATVLLGGCTEKQEANDTLPPTSAAETTEALPQVGPAEFPVPDEARTKDEAGVEAFAQYFIDLLNRQQAIPNGQPIRDLGPECQDCLRIAQTFDEAAEAAHRFQGGELSMVGEPGIALEDDTVNFSFVARIEAVATVDSNGVVVPGTEYDARERLPSGFSLTWSPEDETWLVSGAFFG